MTRCPKCAAPCPDGATSCRKCGFVFSSLRAQSKWTDFSTDENSGEFYQLPEDKIVEGASLFEEDELDAESSTKEIPVWGKGKTGPKPVAAPKDPVKEAFGQDIDEELGEVSGTYENTFLRKFVSNLPPVPLQEDAVSSTGKLPVWDERMLIEPAPRPPAVPSRPSPTPPPPPAPSVGPMAGPPVRPSRPPSVPPPLPLEVPRAYPVPPQAAPAPPVPAPPAIDSVIIEQPPAARWSTHPPAPPPAAAAVAGPARRSRSSRVIILMICFLALTIMLLGVSSVLIYVLKKQSPGSLFGSRSPAAAGQDTAASRPGVPPPAGKTKGDSPGRAPSTKAQAETPTGPAAVTSPEEEPASRVKIVAPLKNLNPLLNEPPPPKLYQGKIFEAGDIVGFQDASFTIERPATVHPASLFHGKIQAGKTLVDVEIGVKGASNLNRFKVFIFDASGEKRGPNSSTEKLLELPGIEGEVHAFWKKTSEVPEGQTWYLHRGFLVSEDRASSFVIEIAGRKSGKVLWIKIADEIAGD